MGARRYGINLRVFNSIAHDSTIELFYNDKWLITVDKEVNSHFLETYDASL